jgi:hypothetical protein
MASNLLLGGNIEWSEWFTLLGDVKQARVNAVVARESTELSLTGGSFTALPESFGLLLGTLTVLDLSGCSSLTVLPESSGQLGALTRLDLIHCCSLTVLPESFGQLRALTQLNLYGCSSLTVLPESFGQLRELTELCLEGCSSLTVLPESFGQLWALTILNFRGCSLNSSTRAWASSLLNRNRIIIRTFPDRFPFSAQLFQNNVLRASALPNTLPSEIRRLVADFAGVPYRAAVAQWVEEVERRLRS